MELLSGNHIHPIGVDMGDDALSLAQLVDDNNIVRLLACDSIECPADIKPGTVSWQGWAIEAIARSVAHGRFQGRKVIAAMPARELFIETIRTPKVPEDQFRNAMLVHLTAKLRVAPDDILMEHFKTDGENVLLIATDKT